MMIALRYVEKDGGYWEVRTEAAIEQHTSLRRFQEQTEITTMAARALQEPGAWIETPAERKYE